MSEPPPVPPTAEPEGIFTGVRPAAVLFGIVVDYVATAIAGPVVTIALASHMGLDPGQLSEENMAELLQSTELMGAMFALGALCTVLGGYAAARRAGTREIKHGGFVGAASILIGLIMQGAVEQSATYPAWFLLLGILIAIPAGMAGGALAQPPVPGPDDR